MHKSAMRRMKWFVDNYIPKDKKVRVLDVGSYNVNGSYRTLFSGTQVEYIGLDMCAGPNVDYVPKNPYLWSDLEDESFDFIISGNAFEHIEFPWVTMEQIYAKLKEGGIICILAPFAHIEHRYPTDCYRYFSDGFIALAKWVGLQVIEATVGGILQESINDPEWISADENYDDTMMIAIKAFPEEDLNKFPKLGATRLTRKWHICT